MKTFKFWLEFIGMLLKIHASSNSQIWSKNVW
jgi:hypothetical protein